MPRCGNGQPYGRKAIHSTRCASRSELYWRSTGACRPIPARNLDPWLPRLVSMSEVGVMHLLDTLALGGAERAGVNLVSEMPRDKYRPYLCTTRREGPLREAVAAGVGRIALERKNRFDHGAIRRLVE